MTGWPDQPQAQCSHSLSKYACELGVCGCEYGPAPGLAWTRTAQGLLDCPTPTHHHIEPHHTTYTPGAVHPLAPTTPMAGATASGMRAAMAMMRVDSMAAMQVDEMRLLLKAI